LRARFLQVRLTIAHSLHSSWLCSPAMIDCLYLPLQNA
jgi:hypothetical protein